jgi:UDP-glucose 4-epimerase
MINHGVKKIVFSSSATVYGDPHTTPIEESFPLSATNPYGRTKLMIEEILRDLYVSDNEWSISLLRYFNPIGAHVSGRIGEDPNGIPNNLMPYITQVAVGKREKLSVFGDDYDTHDGTGVRDYIHVVDLAKGHLAALDYVMTHQTIEAVNLGTGTGYSVLDVVNAFESATGKSVPYIITERRPGDIASCYADPQKAFALLGWKTERNIEEMCRDSWKWQSDNPNGYGK